MRDSSFWFFVKKRKILGNLDRKEMILAWNSSFLQVWGIGGASLRILLWI